MTSPFLQVPESEWVASNALAFALRDRYPVSPGHTLVVPRRVVATWFEATPEEQRALLELVEVVKRQLDEQCQPDGYNVGFNVGEAAGQTVFHLHVHVIPRYRGDVADPRGGVRHVIPGKGNYLVAAPKPLATGGAEDPFLRHLEPLFAQAHEVAVLAAFVQDSGLEVLREPVEGALERGARVRLLTSDYLNITQAAALRRLLDWMEESQARREEEREEAREVLPGTFEARVVEVEGLGRSFHPKSWRFEGPRLAAAYVGSSNVSHAALKTGVEWNLRLDRDTHPRAWREVVEAFEGWWERARQLDSAWVERYAARVRQVVHPPPAGETEEETPAPRAEPHEVQREALAALAASREAGYRRALVVLATGLGKTLLAVLDIEAFQTALGKRPRVLFLAHRAELLTQAAEAFRRQMPELHFDWFIGAQGGLDGDVVFASVQKLSRSDNLSRLRKVSFDYVVVDEVHHAAAASYRAILGRLEPRFLLGLTATPERADEGDVLGLFDDHVAYRADVGEGVARGLLVPFAYHGLKDDVAYENIPWRNQRFSTEQLAAAVQTEARMQRMWQAWQQHQGQRSLVFCCSVSHAEYVKSWLADRGVRVAAVHSGPGTADRVQSLRQLVEGELEAVCAVDLFNEGVDVPSVDRVVMLRPTESPVVFLQQLGRGLRRADGKTRVTVIDFVGNHRVFLDRVRALLALGTMGRQVSLRGFLEQGKEPELPPGCSVQVELEAKELLARLLPRGRSEVERVYRELRQARGRRPTAGELYRTMGRGLDALRPSYRGWLWFLEAEGDLTEQEQRALAAGASWFEELETTPMSKSFKMVLLEALLEAGALGEGLPLEELARRSWDILQRSPELRRELAGVKALQGKRKPPEQLFLEYWKENPVNAWTQQSRWFRLENGRFVSQLPMLEDARGLFEELTRELVDYRLARYRARTRMEASGKAFEARVLHEGSDPLLGLPERESQEGWQPEPMVARLPDGSPWRFRWTESGCRSAGLVGAGRNGLPDLLRRWFGPTAGLPGASGRVRFVPSPDGWWAEPVEAEVVPLAPRGRVVAFPSLRAAAGAVGATLLESAPEAEAVSLPARMSGADVFAVRASGDSMEGGERPIRDGDWLVMRYARAAGVGAVEGQVALVQVPDPAGYGYQVKRVVREGRRWMLRSDNPERPSFEASRETVPIALLVEVIAPERLGPTPGTSLTDEQAMSAFGLSVPPKTGRHEGHLFLCIASKGALVEPDRAAVRVADRRPGETAFLLTRAEQQAPWRYAGVARWLEDEGAWALAEPVDHDTWRALGHGRGSSRRLPAGATERASAWVEQFLKAYPPGQVLEHGGKRCRILGRARGGGIRIDGGEGGFAERTVTLTDLAWALLAAEDVQATGGLLDEARVNRLRYLEGTPKGATRWIDTGWALLLRSC